MEEEEEGNEEGNDITQNEHERNLEDAYRSFVFPSLPKSVIDSTLKEKNLMWKHWLKNNSKGQI